MDPLFRELVDSLEPTFRRLMAMPPVKYGALPPGMPSKGIYLFSKGAKNLYVGRTNRLRQRLQSHCRPSGTHFTATFAFRIARHKTGRTKASYTKVDSRHALSADQEFDVAFRAAKRDVAAMDIRFVEVTDPKAQALLEIYAATVLDTTKYNDFDNH